MNKGLLGLIAVLLTLLLFSVVGFGVYFATRPPADPHAGLKAGPAKSDSVPLDALGRIVAHKFWRKKIARADVERIIEVVRAEPRSSAVVVDDQGRVAVAKDVFNDLTVEGLSRDNEVRRIRVGQLISQQLPEGFGDRRVSFWLADEYAARPDAREVAASLLAMISVRDYDD